MASQTLEEIREEALEWLDNPEGDKYAEGSGDDRFKRLDSIINRAYRHLVGVVERSGQVWNRCDHPVAIEVTEISREYPVKPSMPEPGAFGSTPLVRKILDVTRFRVESSGDVREVPLVIIAWSKRDQFARRQIYPYVGAADSYGWTDQLYVYRYGSLNPSNPVELSRGHWVVGYVDPKPATQSIHVYYCPEILPLKEPSHIPIQVPEQWQGLIAMKAGLYGMSQTARRRDGLLIDYREELALMMEDLSTTTSASKSRPI